MDKEKRFDHLVGLIYETAHNAQGPDSIIDAIDAELDAFGDYPQLRDSQRDFIRSYVSDVVLNQNDLDASQPALSPDARRLLERLAPHMERSASMRQRMRKLEEQQAIRQMELVHLPFGLVWIGPELEVITINARADEIMKSGDGLGIRDGCLHTWLPMDLERLQLALQAAMRPTERKGSLLAIRRRAHTLPLLASIIPAVLPPYPGLAPLGPLALLILPNPNEAAFGLAHLQVVYGFTSAECTLAEALVHNETVEKFAERTGVSQNTVRSHLARLFTKTGTSRQAALVRLLMLAQSRL